MKMIIFLCMLVSSQALAAERTIQQTLRELQSIEAVDPDTTVPLQARPLLTELKHQLRDRITEILNVDPSYMDHLQTDARLHGYLQKQLQLRGVRLTEDSQD